MMLPDAAPDRLDRRPRHPRSDLRRREAATTAASHGRRPSSRSRPLSRACSGSCGDGQRLLLRGRGKINAFTVAILIPNSSVRSSPTPRSPARSSRSSASCSSGASGARLARRVDAVLADAARARRHHGAVHPGRTAPDEPFGDPGATSTSRSASPACCSRSSSCSGSRGSSSGSSTRTTTSRCPALAPGGVEPRHHPGTRPRGAAPRRRERAALPVRGCRRPGDARPGFLLPIPWLRSLDGRLTMVIDWRDPAVRRVLALMLPVTLTIGLVNVNFLVDTLFASRLLDPELAPAAIDKAFRLYMLPQGHLRGGGHDRALPDARPVSGSPGRPGVRASFDSGLRQIAFILVPRALVSDRARGADRAPRSTSGASSPPRTRRSSRSACRRSRSGSSSTAGC